MINFYGYKALLRKSSKSWSFGEPTVVTAVGLSSLGKESSKFSDDRKGILESESSFIGSFFAVMTLSTTFSCLLFLTNGSRNGALSELVDNVACPLSFRHNPA